MLLNRSMVIALVCCVAMRENLPSFSIFIFRTFTISQYENEGEYRSSLNAGRAPDDDTGRIKKDSPTPDELPIRGDELPPAAESDEDPEIEEIQLSCERTIRDGFAGHRLRGEVHFFSFTYSVSFHAFKHLRI
jgi:hypothetical protein